MWFVEKYWITCDIFNIDSNKCTAFDAPKTEICYAGCVEYKDSVLIAGGYYNLPMSQYNKSVMYYNYIKHYTIINIDSICSGPIWRHSEL